MGQVVLDHDDLARRLKGLKAGGKRVVVTNGCFDLLHVGHVRCLQDAARRGDCLVVALNSDSSVRKLKGAGRPIQPQDERAEIVAAITGVDYVTLFEEESVGPLLRRLRPTMLAKGTDYNGENLPERDVLAEIGAELIVVGDPKGHSTRDLLKRAHASHATSQKRKGPGPTTRDGHRKEGRPGRPARPAAKGSKGMKGSKTTRGGKASEGGRRRGRQTASEAHA
jgi:rfaE bifunctional protein nucleotidyltransferase chain/domain